MVYISLVDIVLGVIVGFSLASIFVLEIQVRDLIKSEDRLKEKLKKICPHKVILDLGPGYGFECIICKKFFVRDTLPKKYELKTTCFKKVGR